MVAFRQHGQHVTNFAHNNKHSKAIYDQDCQVTSKKMISITMMNKISCVAFLLLSILNVRVVAQYRNYTTQCKFFLLGLFVIVCDLGNVILL